ncbi:hypothetical protein CANCADRAFT_4491 [Tortispora caseinolytica NRRL Y-17796]|uniref:Uncharacterized protein n=1 Tax=Tortispora caseinolytica NRRL Y-17796 TaxID=767744 RepID=A0A1E4T9N0_9ASCO|nr:hypothetical protein CANCADRAFT_4491 [Tortispora caseinolytica NRRL Y-17796]
MAPIHDKDVLIIFPGSEVTHVQYGLPESFTPPSVTIPSVIYKHPDGAENHFSAVEGTPVSPIVAGKIVDLPAFCYLLRVIIKTFVPIGASPAVLLASSIHWTPLQIERITQFVFQTCHVPYFTIELSSLLTTCAYNCQTSLVIEVGKEKTDITPIIDWVPGSSMAVTVEAGGDTVTQSIIDASSSDISGPLSWDQATALKKSGIYEVFNKDSDSYSRFFGEADTTNKESDAGEFDVAKIVVDGKAQEFVASHEKTKAEDGEEGQNSESDLPNHERDTNFLEYDGMKIEVGSLRFQGTEDLVNKIVDGVGIAVSHIDSIPARQDCWSNICLVGRTLTIPGLKESIMAALHARYNIVRSSTMSEIPTNINTPGNQTPTGSGSGAATPIPGSGASGTPAPEGYHDIGHGQVPTYMRLAKISEHFPEWKNYKIEDTPFLGAQIAAKVIFGAAPTASDSLYVTRYSYNISGPRTIWDVYG